MLNESLFLAALFLSRNETAKNSAFLNETSLGFGKPIKRPPTILTLFNHIHTYRLHILIFTKHQYYTYSSLPF